MPHRPQEYLRPQTLEEALAQLAQPDTLPLAGGTTLLADDVPAQRLVDLQALDLRYIDLLEHELVVGATTTLSDLLESSELHGPQLSLLHQALWLEGPNTLRNTATIGGTMATRGENSLLLALLLVWEAELELAQAQGSESLPLRDYLAAEAPPAGLITRLRVPWQDGRGSLHHVARTPADVPIVGVVGWQGAGGQRLAATGIQARPTLLSAQALETPITHPGDFRGSVEYRRAMLEVLLARVQAQL